MEQVRERQWSRFDSVHGLGKGMGFLEIEEVSS